MADEVARLVAVMEAQLRGFTKGMEQAQRIADQRFGQIERRMTRTERVFGTAFSGVGRNLTRFLSVAAITAFTRSLINTADRLKDTADQIGITTQQLQELQFAARQTGGSQDAIAGSLAILNDRLGDAAKGEGELAEIMRELNIPMGTALQVLNDLADATQNAATQSDKARIATAAFGRAGNANISFLSQGSKGLGDLADEAHRLNQVWDQATIDRLNALKDSFSNIGAALTNLAAGPIAQGLSGLADFINRISQGDWPSRLQDLTAFFVSIATLGQVQLERSILDPIEKAQQRSAELRADIEKIDQQLAAPNILPGTQLTLQQARLQKIIELSKQFNDIALKQKFDPPDPARGGAPPPPPGGKDPERQLLDFLGLPDLPSGEKFMELYWQTMADKAAAASGAAAAENRFDPRVITPAPGPTEGTVDISDIVGFGGPEIQELTEEFDFFTETAKDGLVDVGLAAVRGFDDAKDAAGRLLERLADMILEFGVLRPLIQSIFGGGGSGGLLGSLFGSFAGGFAQGGLIPRGQWGVVHGGEAVLSTSQGARVIPSAQMPHMATPLAGRQTASISINQNFSLDGAMGDQGVRMIARQAAAEGAAVAVQTARRAMPGWIVEAQKRSL